MDANKFIKIQKQVRDDSKTLNSYLTDLQSWELEMKRKEAALRGDFEQDLPPVRSKTTKERPVVPIKKKPEKRISAFDYKAWDSFDVDKACEDIDMAEVGPSSLDGKKSEQAKQEKLREEAQYEKERGNNFVKQEKWDEAITCYNRAIELVKDDAIYFANRGLCHLKKESLHQAEKDCTEALRLDPTYVKALQRRATAREKLGSLRAASQDLNEVLKLEPNNAASRKQFLQIKARMGTKGSKSKSSPLSSPMAESRPITETAQSKVVELENQPTRSKKTPAKVEEIKTEVKKEQTAEDRWRNGIGENITVIKPVKKPPHLRSKRALKTIPIQEIKLGKSSPEKASRIQIIEIQDEKSHGDDNNNKNLEEKSTVDHKTITKGEGDNKIVESAKILNPNFDEKKVSQTNGPATPESDKLRSDVACMEKSAFNVEKLVPPQNSVQFMLQWKNLKDNSGARCEYLSIIEPSKIPSIFENALESDILSEVLAALKADPNKFRAKTITAYLQGLVRVKRFSALAMFLSSSDKELVNKLLVHCRAVEQCSDETISDLKNKFEL